MIVKYLSCSLNKLEIKKNNRDMIAAYSFGHVCPELVVRVQQTELQHSRTELQRRAQVTALFPTVRCAPTSVPLDFLLIWHLTLGTQLLPASVPLKNQAVVPFTWKFCQPHSLF